MKAEENRKTIERYYRCLAEGDAETFASLHTEDVVFNLIGNTPVSGRFLGRAACFSEVAARVVRALVPGRFRFAKKWRIMAVEENCVVGIMQGGGTAKNGLEYEQTYCQVFTMHDGKIAELHEFFDTALAEEALFGNRLERPQTEPAFPFEF
ncbi:MAG: nuclear transport factor 2 family protein [Deltaproteobacteria bacterium]|nr:nuclear transport factor 2 family protein [Deltaproteobacteria bacterium]